TWNCFPLVDILPTPAAPTAVAGNAEATVSWTPVAGAASYTATASPGGATCTGSGTSCSVTGLTNGTAYTFTVVAAQSLGSDTKSLTSSDSNAATPQGAPPAPTPTPTPAPASIPTPSATPEPSAATTGAPGLKARVTPSQRRLVAGEELTLDVGVSNIGTAAASNVGACVEIPAGFELVRAPGGRVRDGAVCYAVGVLQAPTARRLTARVAARSYRIVLRAQTVSVVRFAVTLSAAGLPTRKVVMKASKVRVAPRPGEPITG
ncbi:MAG: fibronectin type III domain-containing protein, partial [Gaiellales bacterium]